MRNASKMYVLLVLTGLFLLMWASPGESRSGKKSSEPVKARTTTSVDASQYIGSDICMTCHEDLGQHFQTTPHAKTQRYSNWTVDMKGCEACHGPGKAHVEGGGDKSKILRLASASPSEVTNVCLKCHEGQEERHNFRRSEHNTNAVSCVACHSPHHAKQREALLREEPAKLCLSCHGEVRTEFAMPFHHKVPEGSMRCTECHNQHGGFNPRQTRASTGADVICVKCHSDKQGPFAFEHAPVKVEGCTVCHTPHGATNARLLRRNEVRFLCIECHSNVPGIPGERGGITPSFHNIALPRFQSCTTCHVNIHGSNLSRVFFQ